MTILSEWAEVLTLFQVGNRRISSSAKGIVDKEKEVNGRVECKQYKNHYLNQLSLAFNLNFNLI